MADATCTADDDARPLPPSRRPEARRARYQANRERVLAERRERTATDPDFCQERARKMREHRARNPEPHRQRDARRKARSLVVRAKVHIGHCLRCGYDGWTGALQWAHVDAGTKVAEPSRLVRASDRDAYLELDKCILICANCHWEEGAGRWRPDEGMLATSRRLLLECLHDPALGVVGPDTA